MSDKAKGKRSIARTWRRRLFVWALIGPALVIVLVYAYWPIATTVNYSLHDWNGFSRDMTWVGWGNYQQLLADANFLRSLLNNLLIVAVSLLIQLPMSFLTAYAIFKLRSKWAEAAKVLFYLPCILSMVMIGLLWRFIYDYQYGALNSVIRAVNLPGLARVWLTDPRTAFPAILVVVVWVYLGYHCLIHSAGLHSLPVEILEAAKVDGAEGWRLVLRIIVPMLSEVIRVSLIISLVGSFQFFDLIWILTGGGPFHKTDVLATYMYNRAFQAQQFGYAAAIAVVILACALLATVIQNLWQRERAKGEVGL